MKLCQMCRTTKGRQASPLDLRLTSLHSAACTEPVFQLQAAVSKKKNKTHNKNPTTKCQHTQHLPSLRNAVCMFMQLNTLKQILLATAYVKLASKAAIKSQKATGILCADLYSPHPKSSSRMILTVREQFNQCRSLYKQHVI